jgi:hypothetical protein
LSGGVIAADAAECSNFSKSMGSSSTVGIRVAGAGGRSIAISSATFSSARLAAARDKSSFACIAAIVRKSAGIAVAVKAPG